MRILVDLHGTIADLHSKWIYYRNRDLGHEAYKIEDMTTWERFAGLEWEKILRIPGFLDNLPFLPGAEDGLRELAERGHEVYVVSAPVVWDGAAGVYRWVHSMLKVPGIIPSMNRLVLTRSKHLIRGDILIDDSPENLMSWKVANPTGYCVLMDQPWNSRFEVPYAREWFRAQGWAHLESILDVIERQELRAAR